MDGYLLKQGHVVRSWQKRFFRLDAANCVLEYFMDHTSLELRGKIILSDADVKMGDEIGLIGEGIASPADTRRFVFRVVDGHTKRAYYMCADVSESREACRQLCHAWVDALHATIAKARRTAVEPSSDTIALNEMTFTACVSNGRMIANDEAFELTCRAAVALASSRGDVEEFACNWTLWKRRAEWTALDQQLRRMFPSATQSLVLPSLHAASAWTCLLHGAAKDPMHKTVEALDAYLQHLLALDLVSQFDKEGTNFVLEFLEYSSHAAQLPDPNAFVQAEVAPLPERQQHHHSHHEKKESHQDHNTAPVVSLEKTQAEVHDDQEDVKTRIAKIGRKVIDDGAPSSSLST
ncbi:hypothetical protein AeNC1_003668 [Aphanomyces euteiches]|nr:hypothetical protein AeNC1_003668 [Aphanomyces euteiches]